MSSTEEVFPARAVFDNIPPIPEFDHRSGWKCLTSRKDHRKCRYDGEKYMHSENTSTYYGQMCDYCKGIHKSSEPSDPHKAERVKSLCETYGPSRMLESGGVWGPLCGRMTLQQVNEVLPKTLPVVERGPHPANENTIPSSSVASVTSSGISANGYNSGLGTTSDVTTIDPSLLDCSSQHLPSCFMDPTGNVLPLEQNTPVERLFPMQTAQVAGRWPPESSASSSIRLPGHYSIGSSGFQTYNTEEYNLSHTDISNMFSQSDSKATRRTAGASELNLNLHLDADADGEASMEPGFRSCWHGQGVGESSQTGSQRTDFQQVGDKDATASSAGLRVSRKVLPSFMGPGAPEDFLTPQLRPIITGQVRRKIDSAEHRGEIYGGMAGSERATKRPRAPTMPTQDDSVLEDTEYFDLEGGHIVDNGDVTFPVTVPQELTGFVKRFCRSASAISKKLPAKRGSLMRFLERVVRALEETFIANDSMQTPVLPIHEPGTMGIIPPSARAWNGINKTPQETFLAAPSSSSTNAS